MGLPEDMMQRGLYIVLSEGEKKMQDALCKPGNRNALILTPPSLPHFLTLPSLLPPLTPLL